ncbi:MAG TPA: hypothetical protein PKH24_18720 [Sedimentisphaerales bacterium]|nr:hypothetical protein [Sedimentisphaerales bacterium]HNU31060.1 hypothetical protein [Sedimentisphaerales bacterium]
MSADEVSGARSATAPTDCDWVVVDLSFVPSALVGKAMEEPQEFAPAFPTVPLPPGPESEMAAAVTVVPDPSSENTGPEATTELVGFVVRGRRHVERLQVDDMDSLVLSDGRRLLPLLRTLRTFRVAMNEQGGVLKFTPEGGSEVELDIPNGRIRIKGQTRPLEFRQAVSEITLKPDIYIAPEDLSEILDMELVWNDQLYEYRIQLDRKLSIWKTRTGRSLLSAETQYIEMDLPEPLPPADRSEDLLQFAQVEWHPSYSWRHNTSQGNFTSESRVVNIAGPSETLWGNWSDGQYKIRISHPSRTWSNTEGWEWPNDDPYVAEADWFEWVHRWRSAEITVGDSTFGLSDLVYPAFHATGVRINGLAGWTAEELKADKSSLGLRQYFGQPHVFEGPAPIDATVELQLNGRTIDIQTVRPQADAPPGMGTYRFDGIDLPSGILNEVTIVIREPDGNEIRVEKSIVGTPQLLPKGRTAYLGLVGTKREGATTDHECLDAGDFYGHISGARLLHGVSDRLSLGVVLACEEDHHHRYLEKNNHSDDRSYPESSGHAGTTLSYLPFDNLILSGNLAASQGQGQDEYDDAAIRTRAEYLPTQKLSLDLDLLNLGSDYFDGTDPDVCDRRGGEAGFSWALDRKWTVEGGIGWIRDNLDGELTETTQVSYQNIGASTRALPRVTLGSRFHLLDVSTENEPRTLTELSLRTALRRDLNLYGQVFLGEELSVNDNDRFLSLLRLRHAPRVLRPSQYWTLRKTVNANNTISLIYNDTEAEETLSVVHDLKIDRRRHPWRLRTEILKELSDETGSDEYGFRLRGEYLLDRVGFNYISATGEYRQGDYAFLLSLNIKQLYSRHQKRMININESRVRTAYGAIHGKVFLDYNGNHFPDRDEPGVPGVKVCLGQNLSVLTDKKGYYILSARPNTPEVQVYLDPDTIPAIYTVTNGTQKAKLYRDSLTEVNLSVAPLISMVGRVVAVDPNTPDANAGAEALDIAATVLDGVAENVQQSAPLARHPACGVRVSLHNPQSGLLAAESITGQDGSYYLGDVKPGRYVLRVDPKTLPALHELAESERAVEVATTREEFVEIEQPDFVAIVQKNDKPAPDSSKE